MTADALYIVDGIVVSTLLIMFGLGFIASRFR
jgi:hypothetical protein